MSTFTIEQTVSSAPRRTAWKSRLPWLAGFAVVLIGALGADGWLHAWTIAHFRTPSPTDVDWYDRTRAWWEICKFPGSLAGGLAALFAIWIFHPRGGRTGCLGLASVLLAVFVGYDLKMAVGRMRPEPTHAGPHLVLVGPKEAYCTPGARSFPSGEAISAFAVAACVGMLYPGLRWPLYAAAAMAALGRLAIGAHYLSDVAAGSLIGAALARTAMAFLLEREERIWAFLLRKT